MGGLAGIAGLVQIVLGVLFWTGHATALIPLHMLIGFVFVLALWALCGLGVCAHLPLRTVLVALVWSVIVPALGMAQMQLLPGPANWVVKVVRLVVGLIAMGQARRLALRIQAVPAGPGAVAAPSELVQPAQPRP